MKIFILVLAVVFCCASCHKYEDGNVISLRSEQQRLCNHTWTGTDTGGDHLNLEFKKSGTVIATDATFSENGTYTMKKGEFETNFGGVTDLWIIQELSNTTLHVLIYENGSILNEWNFADADL